MKVTATQLRANIYAILDQVLATGETVEIERHGRIVRLQPVAAEPRLERIESDPQYIVGDPDDLVELDLSHEWSELPTSSSTRTSSSGSSGGRRTGSATKHGR